MTETLLLHEIDRLLDAIDGELMSKSRVVDGLLDLRLVGADKPLFVAAIDQALVDIPGRTTVTNGWWVTTLEDLRNSSTRAGASAN